MATGSWWSGAIERPASRNPRLSGNPVGALSRAPVPAKPENQPRLAFSRSARAGALESAPTGQPEVLARRRRGAAVPGREASFARGTCCTARAWGRARAFGTSRPRNGPRAGPPAVQHGVRALARAQAAVAAGGAQALEAAVVVRGHERRRAGGHVGTRVARRRGARAPRRRHRSGQHREREGAGNQLLLHGYHPSTFVIETQVFL